MPILSHYITSNASNDFIFELTHFTVKKQPNAQVLVPNSTSFSKVIVNELFNERVWVDVGSNWNLSSPKSKLVVSISPT